MGVLTKIKSAHGGERTGPVALFAVMRNERKILPHFLDHYRKLGVSDFFLVDNDSDDGQREWLEAQKDVTLYFIKGGYANSNCGTDWINEMIQAHGVDRWCLHVDADEMFVYAGCEETPIAAYAAALDREGARAVFAFMLDFYPSGSLAEGRIDDRRGPFAACPSLDSEYVFRNYPVKPWAKEGFPKYEVVGGPRVRLWSGLETEARTTWFHYTLRGQIDRFEPFVPDFAFPTFVRFFDVQPPHLQKVPFVRPRDAGFRYHMGAHACDLLPLADESAVLCHFKFTADFHARVLVEVERAEHFRRGSQYIRYKQLIFDKGRDSFVYPGSVTYRDSWQLAELGIIRRLSTIGQNLQSAQLKQKTGGARPWFRQSRKGLDAA
jgi:hypothetical protein